MREYVVDRPRGALRGAVMSAVGYRISGQGPTPHRGLPSPWLTFVLSVAGPVPTSESASAPRATHRYVSLVGGLHTSPVFIDQHAEQAGIQLAIDPLAARALLGAPASELGLVEDADTVLGRASRTLRERVGDAGPWAAGLDLVAGFLTRRLGPDRPSGAAGTPVRAEVREAWRTILRRRGRVRVPHLARHVLLSERQLGALFRAELGMSPRTACRLVRFDGARRAVGALAVGAGAHRTLADVAAAHGYADHSHLVRDFREFVGTSPTAWLAEERGNVQALTSVEHGG